ncbi:MAG: presenilin family intramembrane aspartyl protease PSH [Halobacteria archaeon]
MTDERTVGKSVSRDWSALDLVPYLGMFGLFLAVEVLAVSLAPAFDAAGLQATENPGNPVNSLIYVAFILVFTGFLLAAMKYGGEIILQLVILGSVAYLVFFLLTVFLPFPAAVGGAVLIAALLYFHPEWYVINTAGVLMGASGAGLFGISFGILPAVLLLVILAVYDAIAVYRTKHMLTLADGVMDLKLPVMFVIPKRLDFSFIEMAERQSKKDDGTNVEPESAREKEEVTENSEGSAQTSSAESTAELRNMEGDANMEVDGTATEESGAGKEKNDRHEIEKGEKDAFFLGLGDAVIPTVLIASAAKFVEVPLASNYAVYGAVIGSVIGLVILMYQVSKGRAHAGLPLLNGGTILGFFVGGFAMGITPIQLLF